MFGLMKKVGDISISSSNIILNVIEGLILQESLELAASQIKSTFTNLSHCRPRYGYNKHLAI